MPKRTLTQEDIENNQELADAGLKAGDEIDIPESNELTDGDGPTNDPEGGGGGNHPNDPSGKP